MLPAGYMRKRVASNSEWLQTEGVTDVYSVSNCLSNDFADYINFWRHNGYWLFNSPAIIEEISRVENIDLTNTKLFYYEVFEFEYDEDQMQWVTFDPEPSFTTEVKAPTNMQLEGFDVVTFSVHTSPECSPLSCCALAKDLTVNQHCLFRTFAEAKEAIDRGLFNNSEPGPYRIFSVYATAAEPSLRGDGREAAFLGSPSPAAPGRSSSLTLNVIKTKMADRNKIFYRINASLCAIPIISALLLYSLTFHVWYKYRVWPFRDSNPDYNLFTGVLKAHDIFATIFTFYLMPVSFCFWIFGVLDICLYKKESIKRVLLLFEVG